MWSLLICFLSERLLLRAVLVANTGAPAESVPYSEQRTSASRAAPLRTWGRGSVSECPPGRACTRPSHPVSQRREGGQGPRAISPAAPNQRETESRTCGSPLGNG